jgi:hypothetical protein
MATSSAITTPRSLFDITSSRSISKDDTELDSSISAWSASGALEPTPIAMKSVPKEPKTHRKEDAGKKHEKLKKTPSSPLASLGIAASDRTYARPGSTVFDVWRDWNLFMKNTYKPNAIGQFRPKRENSMRIVADELKARMNDANRTIGESLIDLEGARLKMVFRGGSGGTIANLVAAIKLKNGKRIDLRLKNYMPLEY